MFVSHRYIFHLLTGEGTVRIHWPQLVGFLLLAALVGCARVENEEIPAGGGQEHGTETEPCPVTLPGINVVRNGVHFDYDYVVRNSWRFNYGNGELWTGVGREGTILFRARGPGSLNPDGSLSIKSPWYVEQEDFHGELEIQGRRLDAPSERSVSGNHSPVLGDPGFHAGKLTFPSEGCWEVTGKAGDSSLTFVVRVIKGRTLKDEALP